MISKKSSWIIGLVDQQDMSPNCRDYAGVLSTSHIRLEFVGAQEKP